MPEKKRQKFKSSHYQMMKIRGLNPKNFEFVKETYCSLYVRDMRTGKIFIIFKHN